MDLRVDHDTGGDKVEATSVDLRVLLPVDSVGLARRRPAVSLVRVDLAATRF